MQFWETDPKLSFSEALTFLESRINYEQQTSLPYGQRCFKLQRMEDLLGLVGSPHVSLPAIHIAGTKGKGSTAAILSSVLNQAGYQVGRFTSPHLSTVRERLCIGDRLCSEEEFARLIAALIPAVRQIDEWAEKRGYLHGPTYFEIVTAAAFLWFAEQNVQIAVIEVGLGGRLDATNVCRPLVTVITSISFDHTEQLGYSLSSIAREKAGIIKPGVPTVSGVTATEALEVIEAVCQQVKSPLYQLRRDFDYHFHRPQVPEGKPPAWCEIPLFTRFDFLVASSTAFPGERAGHQQDHPRTNFEPVYTALDLPLLGQHQAANAAVAVATIEQLRARGFEVSESALRDGLRHTSWPARVEILSRRPVVIVDGAHNEASIRALLETIREYFGRRPLKVLFGTSRDKDIPAMLRQLIPECSLLIMTQYRSSFRAAAAEDLVRTALILGASDNQLALEPDPVSGWQKLKADGKDEDILCVTGSLFLAGELRPLILADLNK
jgi:dihydrofolate synthase/folylpolyglutamate synthase